MIYRRLGRTGFQVSEIGLGAEWLERHNAEECRAVIDCCEENGINILDCWMSEPNVRSNIGAALKGKREKWYIQGHLCTSWHDNQHHCTRDMGLIKKSFPDLLRRLQTDYVDIGMIHCMDKAAEWEEIHQNGFLEYAAELKAAGVIRHLGVSSHNPVLAAEVLKSGLVDVLMFSINPAFDLLPPSEDMETYFVDEYDPNLKGIEPKRTYLYKLCEQLDIGMTVMKGYAGGRLFDAQRSPFGMAMTPVQCIHYCLTKPGVSSVMVGMETPEQVAAAVAYETAGAEEKDYATVLSQAPRYAFGGQCTYCGHCRPCPQNIDVALVNKFYDLAAMQPELPTSLAEHYRLLEAHAGDCIFCGGCEERCPFAVPVMEHMQKAAELFGY